MPEQAGQVYTWRTYPYYQRQEKVPVKIYEEILLLGIILAHFGDFTIWRSALEMLGPFQCVGV